MSDQEEQPDIPDREENSAVSGEAWYAGLNSPLEDDSRAICTLLMSYLGVGPRSKGVEYILSALEGPGDNRKKAKCLGEVMEFLANDPSDYYSRLQPKDMDYSTDHGFDHRSEDFYEALGIDKKGKVAVFSLVVEISKGIMQSITGSGRLTADRCGLVFEKMFDTHAKTDKKIVATAIYNFFTAPLPKLKTFGPPVKLPWQ